MKSLEYLLAGEKRQSNNFLFRKITELIHIQIKDTTTYEQLGKLMLKYFEGKPQETAAVYTWLGSIDWDYLKNEAVCDFHVEPGILLFAIFDLKEV